MQGRRRRAGVAPEAPPSERDVDTTPFGRLLEALLGRVPGAYAAALVDSEGETVDYAGDVDPFEIRVAAAHCQILLRHVDELGALGRARRIVVRAAKSSFLVEALEESYALVVLLGRRAGFAASRRAFSVCARELAAEAGWTIPKGPAWHPVRVEAGRDGRPLAVVAPGAIGPTAVEILGSVVGATAHERAFRVRTSEGVEVMLVREPGRQWYADEDLEHARSDRPPTLETR